MKISNQIISALVVILGSQMTAQAAYKKASPAPKAYKVQNCDCIGNHDGIPTFLSDLIGEVSITATARSRKSAEAKVFQQCVQGFKSVAKKTRAFDIAASGCRTKVALPGRKTWKEI